jgi:hypothetical protein
LTKIFEDLSDEVQVKQHDIEANLLARKNTLNAPSFKKSLINSYFKSAMEEYDENIERIISDRFPIYPLVEDSKRVICDLTSRHAGG